MDDIYRCDDCDAAWSVPAGVTLRCQACYSKNRTNVRDLDLTPELALAVLAFLADRISGVGPWDMAVVAGGRLTLAGNGNSLTVEVH